MKCVKCFEEATEGSMQHPYCKKCFKEVWDDSNKKYLNWLEVKHSK